MAYIRDERGRLLELSKHMSPDLKAVAIDASAEDSIQVCIDFLNAVHTVDILSQLAKAVLLAAMYSPISNQRMVGVMGMLGQEVAIPIATWIGNVEQAERRLGEAEGRMDTDSDVDFMTSPIRAGTPQNAGVVRDPELEREEELIEAYASIKTLEERNQTSFLELQNSRTQISRLENELNETKYQLEQGGQSSASKEYLEQLQEKSARERDHIAELELELGEYKSQVESQERQLERLKVDSEAKQKLRDELQILRVERDDLAQKSKANENLKKKIQTLQDSDKSNQSLRQELGVAEELAKSLRPFKDRCAALQKANEENLKTIQNGEQEIFDQKTTRKRLEHEMKLLAQRWEASKERQQRDADTINEQQERIQELEAGESGQGRGPGSLEDELTINDKVANDL